MTLHPLAFALDEDGLGMLEEPVEDSGNQGAVAVENLWSVSEGTALNNDDGTLPASQTEDLKEQIGTVFVEWC